jgi:hypothetical protein
MLHQVFNHSSPEASLVHSVVRSRITSIADKIYNYAQPRSGLFGSIHTPNPQRSYASSLTSLCSTPEPVERTLVIGVAGSMHAPKVEPLDVPLPTDEEPSLPPTEQRVCESLSPPFEERMVETDCTSVVPNVPNTNEIILLDRSMFVSDPNKPDSKLKDVVNSCSDRLAPHMIKSVNSVALLQKKLTACLHDISEYFFTEQCTTDNYINDNVAFNNCLVDHVNKSGRDNDEHFSELYHIIATLKDRVTSLKSCEPSRTDLPCCATT